MKILLFGEFSGLHYNLSKGLKELGHEVKLVSSGDSWKGYKRDIDFNFEGKFRKLKILFTLIKNFPKLVNNDVVQLISPIFIDLKPQNNWILFKILKQFNKHVFLGANGSDYIYIKYALTGNYIKSLYNQSDRIHLPRVKTQIEDRLNKDYSELNIKIAQLVKGITSCCAEYQIAYEDYLPSKSVFIPLPIQTENFPYSNTLTENTENVVFFLGHLKDRAPLKGTDVMEKVLLKLKSSYPNDVEIRIVSGVPFDEYQQLFNSSHILCDQLYSYGCGMNGVLGMSKGLIIAGGGEDKMYELMNEFDNRPIINLPTTEDEIFKVFEDLVGNKKELFKRAQKTREFAEKHHNYIKVAQQYLDFWKSKMTHS